MCERIKMMELVMEKKYYDAQVKYINEIRSIRHDIQAHMIVLQYYLESGNYEKAKSYLCDMKQHQNRASIFIKDTGHDLVNAILSDILSGSRKKIDFEMKGLLPQDLCLSEYDICTLFSNLFMNAREACEKLKHVKPVILMEVQERVQECFISIQNPIEWKVETDGMRFLTSKKKKELHGYGTKNILEVIKAYNGKIDFLITEQMFRVEIILNKTVVHK